MSLRPDDLRIGRLTRMDGVEAIAALQAASFAEPWGTDAIQWELENSDVARLYAARAADDELVGYCATWLLFDELHINSLAVAAAWHRRRVARRLLAFVFRDAVAAGATKATLEVRQSNAAARALYEGFGFHVEASRRDYYDHPREDALLLWSRDLVAMVGTLASEPPP
jgi:ribosomal-protein-alanine N-acetyltransferase